MPLSIAIRRARVSVVAGVAGTSCIFQSGWNAVKWIGTSSPRRDTTHFVSLSSSASESFFPGISSVVISNHTVVSCLRYSSVSSTADSWPPQIR